MSCAFLGANCSTWNNRRAVGTCGICGMQGCKSQDCPFSWTSESNCSTWNNCVETHNSIGSGRITADPGGSSHSVRKNCYNLPLATQTTTQINEFSHTRPGVLLTMCGWRPDAARLRFLD